MRHLITGILSNWREFRGKQGGGRGKKKSYRRGQITLGGWWGLKKVPGLEAFRGGTGDGPWGRDEYLDCCWDLAASTSAPSPPHSGELLSCPFHGPFQILLNKQGKIFTVTVRKNIPDQGSWACFLGENLESQSKHKEVALGNLGQGMGIVMGLGGTPKNVCSCLEVLPPAISVCIPVYRQGKGWETAGGSWCAHVSPGEDR